MNGKIDKEGVLKIKRGKSYKVAMCINDPKFELDGCAYCRDNCSHFGEPIEWTDGPTVLSLCQKSLEFTELLDGRE